MTIREIKTFTRDGKKAMIRSTTTKEDRVSMPNGKTKVSKIDDNATTTFADWPSNVEVSPGDVVSFYGAELSVKEVIVRSTTELEHRSREYTIDARHITKIVSKGKTTVYFR
jgi:plastocyanin